MQHNAAELFARYYKFRVSRLIGTANYATDAQLGLLAYAWAAPGDSRYRPDIASKLPA